MKLSPLYLNPDQIALILDCIEIAPDSEANCFDNGWYTSQNRRFPFPLTRSGSLGRILRLT